MIDATVVFLLRDDEILLGMKKTGFGKGKWNGAGGKVEDGESIEQAAIREVEEELSVRIAVEDLEEMGVLEFSFPHKPKWDMRGHVFFCRTWTGEPEESREIRPHWWRIEDIPYERMWDDDKYWLPLCLGGTYVRCDFTFDEDSTVRDAHFHKPDGHVAKPLNGSSTEQTS